MTILLSFLRYDFEMAGFRQGRKPTSFNNLEEKHSVFSFGCCVLKLQIEQSMPVLFSMAF